MSDSIHLTPKQPGDDVRHIPSDRTISRRHRSIAKRRANDPALRELQQPTLVPISDKWPAWEDYPN